MAVGKPEAAGAAPEGPKRSGGWRGDGFLVPRGAARRGGGEETQATAVAGQDAPDRHAHRRGRASGSAPEPKDAPWWLGSPPPGLNGSGMWRPLLARARHRRATAWLRPQPEVRPPLAKAARRSGGSQGTGRDWLLVDPASWRVSRPLGGAQPPPNPVWSRPRTALDRTVREPACDPGGAVCTRRSLRRRLDLEMLTASLTSPSA